jgi:hypothetical protein
MGDCNKMKEHISGYLENTLDPAIRAQFEQELEKSPELRKITAQVARVTMLLSSLPARKCADDFVFELQRRINSAPAGKPILLNRRTYSFAFSFVVIAVVAIFGVKGLLKKEEPMPVLPTIDEYQSAPASVSSGASRAPAGNYSDQNEMDVKTRPVSNMVTDSSNILKNDQNNTQAQQVGHTTK